MPYVDQGIRSLLDDRASYAPETVGELNYCITSLVDEYLRCVNGGVIAYANINAVIGVLECAKLELYRRIAAPYEDKKCAENGDVYVAKP